MRIYCHSQLNDLNAIRFTNDFWRARSESELVIDFSTLSFAFPSGVMVSALGIRDLIRQRHALGLTTHVAGHDTLGGAPSYLRYFGYFQFIGVDAGNQPNTAPGSGNYLPITRISLEDLQSTDVILQDQITKHAKRLTKVIYPSASDISRVDMLTFCLREIVRNVFEHAQVGECYVMAQRWGTGEAEITIADEGVGLAQSLSQAHEISSSRAAIRLAIKPGISCVTDPVNDDKWQNSGFGLYVVSEIGTRLGAFSILSNESMLLLNNQGTKWVATPSRGTIVKLRANTNEAEYFPNLLQSIVDEGEKLAEEILGARPSASKGSRSIDSILW